MTFTPINTRSTLSDFATTSSKIGSSNDDVVVRAERVGKIFCRDLKRSLLYGVVDSLHDLVPGYKGRKPGPDGEIPLRKEEFWANRAISFELRKGECLGLIGHNGAGKTTLLRILNGLIKPDEGFVQIRGRIGALIALGAGFNPILTGRENIHVNGAILGMNRAQINAKFDEILEFADIGKFIDAPVQNYSSGMRVRLGFAIASTLDNDILIIDEVLAVGDFTFKQKCLRRIMSFRDRGGCILFVSHNLNQLQMVCTKGVYLSAGRMLFNGGIEEASQHYFEDIQKKESEARHKGIKSAKAMADFPFAIEQATISSDPSAQQEPRCKQPAYVTVTVNAGKQVDKAFIRLIFLNKEQAIRIATISSDLFDVFFALKIGQNTLKLTLPNLPLVPENYSLRVSVLDYADNIVLVRKGFEDQAFAFRVSHSESAKGSHFSEFGDIIMLDARAHA